VDGETVLADAVDAYRVALGERMVAAYALGSLAHGGFSSLVSDVDLGLIMGDPLRPDDALTIETVADAERAEGSELGQRLSVFWGTPSTLRGECAGGRFPAIDRLDLIQNGRLLAGRDMRAGVPRPAARELTVAGAEFAIEHLAGTQDDAVEEIRRPELLVARGVRRMTKLVLFPVRFVFTAATGEVGTNAAGVDHHLRQSDAPAGELVAAALQWRTAPPVDRWSAAELLRAQIVPLYAYYIDDHIARLDSLGRRDLVRAFTGWRERLAG
jgi:hypothetical protein